MKKSRSPALPQAGTDNQSTKKDGIYVSTSGGKKLSYFEIEPIHRDIAAVVINFWGLGIKSYEVEVARSLYGDDFDFWQHRTILREMHRMKKAEFLAYERGFFPTRRCYLLFDGKGA